MNKNAGSLLMGYGGLTAGLGIAAHHFAPGPAASTMLAGLVGGGFALVWGWLARRGRPRRGWTLLTLAVTGIAALSQAVIHTMPASPTQSGVTTIAWLASAIFLATLATAMVVAHSQPTPVTPGDGGGVAQPAPPQRGTVRMPGVSR